jgi:hypothetical protein
MKYLKKFEIYLIGGDNQNNSVIFDIANKIAEELGEVIENFIDGGSFGYAFETKSGKVLKFTSDEAEFHLAYRLSKNRKWMKCLINYYNVGKIIDEPFYKDGGYHGRDFKWYILMDKVLPLSDMEKNSLSFYQGIIQYRTNYWERINDKEIFDNLSRWDEDRIEIIKNLYPHVLNICKELKLHKIKETDFHSGNIGWDKNRKNLVLFDIGGYVESTMKKGKINTIKL